LREQLGLPVRLSLRTEKRDVWVARGKVKANGSAPVGRQQAPLLIYGKEPPPPADPQLPVTLDGVCHWDGDYGLFDHLGVYVGRRVIADDPASLPKETLHYLVRRDRSTDSGDEGAVIKNVAEQTGLTFTRERRDVRVLWVEKVD
jgi:hypothetical protein